MRSLKYIQLNYNSDQDSFIFSILVSKVFDVFLKLITPNSRNNNHQNNKNACFDIQKENSVKINEMKVHVC